MHRIIEKGDSKMIRGFIDTIKLQRKLRKLQWKTSTEYQYLQACKQFASMVQSESKQYKQLARMIKKGGR